MDTLSCLPASGDEAGLKEACKNAEDQPSPAVTTAAAAAAKPRGPKYDEYGYEIISPSAPDYGAIHTPVCAFTFPLLTRYRPSFVYHLLLMLFTRSHPLAPFTHRLLTLLHATLLSTTPLLHTLTSEFYLTTTHYETALLAAYAKLARPRRTTAARAPLYVPALRGREVRIFTKAGWDAPLAVWASGARTPLYYYQMDHPRGEYYCFQPCYNLSLRRWLEIMVFRPVPGPQLVRLVRNGGLEVVGIEGGVGGGEGEGDGGGGGGWRVLRYCEELGAWVC